jgi:dTMP kinase
MIVDPAEGKLTPCLPGAVFIAVEGIDGVGKSTVIARASEELRERGYRLHVTSEPSGSMIGSLIRELLRGDQEVPHPGIYALLFVADRMYHYYGEVGPMLNAGYIVISERYMESTLAYQGAMGLPMDWLLELHRLLPRPHATIVLDAPVEVAMARLRNRTRLERFEDAQFLNRAREILLGRAREMSYPIIDASKDVETVAMELVKHVLALLTT